MLGFEFSNPDYLKAVLFLHKKSFYLNIWSRLVNPITGGILLFTAIYILFNLFKDNFKNSLTKNTYILILAIVIGVSSGYFFSFSLILIIPALPDASYLADGLVMISTF